ncbi:MAG: phenylalanine--tRNA ligase subunit alpha [Deltaproteobacteria bacterium]|nr:phenylalanine--tRNA ligase subunit alpha [Deltaproteobacteria bacterium]
MASEAPILSPHEVRILQAAIHGNESTIEAIAGDAGLDPAQVRSAIESLKAREYVELTREETLRRAVATDLGRRFAEIGTPELAILAKVAAGETQVAACQDVPGHDRRALGTAFGFLKKEGYLEVQNGRVARSSRDEADLSGAADAFRRLGAASDEGLDWEDLPEFFRAQYQPKKRGSSDAAVELRETVTRWYRLTPSGVAAASALEGAREAPAELTREMLRSGEWREILATTGFRPYKIAEAPIPVVGRRDPYREFLDGVKRKLLALGFEEMTGSLVETEFWDMDALFLPQFHPAREIHDVYFVADGEGGYASQSEVGAAERASIEAVAREHEGRGVSDSRGWGYEFDRDRTRRLVLRSQGTVLSARWLARPDLKNPGKYFAMARCFRYDTVDATHAPDFFQIEGIVVSEHTSFRHLLGLLELFAIEIAGAKELRFLPAYFPFTEPSVEIHVEHPQLGWMELGGAGVFRPEVTRPHGVETPVIAWGLGLDRMAMIALGIGDIRELFSNNVPAGLQSLRDRRAC